LGIFYLKNQLDMFSFLTKNEIPQGMSMAEVHQLACENLEKMAQVKIISLYDFDKSVKNKDAFVEQNRLFMYSFDTNIEDHGCLLVLESFREKMAKLCKGSFYAMMPYNSTAITALNCEPSLLKNAMRGYIDCFRQSAFSVSLQILKYDVSEKRFEVCGNLLTDKPCPICTRIMPNDQNFPNAVCRHCVSKVTDEQGKRVSFGNAGMHGGIKAIYEDGSPYEMRIGHEYICFVEGRMCRASEDRYHGGIVIDKI
jgi:hypothetical protein